jgi:hypothetical protein
LRMRRPWGGLGAGGTSCHLLRFRAELVSGLPAPRTTPQDLGEVRRSTGARRKD